MAIKVRVLAKYEIWSNVEKNLPTSNAVVELNVNNEDEITQSMLEDALCDQNPEIDWDCQGVTKSVLQNTEYTFEIID